MEQKFCCPNCGSKNLQITTETKTQTTGSNYSAGKGCLGYLLFGPLGLLCGACGKGQTTTTTNDTYWVCANCGKRFAHPDELRKKIKELQSQSVVFPAMCITGLVIAIIFLLIFSEISMGFGMFFAILVLGIFVLIGFGTKKANESSIIKLEEELNEIETKMKKFGNE